MFFPCVFVFFFNDTPTPEIYTLSLHDALPICGVVVLRGPGVHQRWLHNTYLGLEPLGEPARQVRTTPYVSEVDRKSTRLNSSHGYISYAVFCLKKKTELQSRLNLV